MHRFRFIFLAFTFSTLVSVPIAALAAADLNARILPTVWFSSLSPKAGDVIYVHGAVQNESGKSFSGTAHFFVDGVDIGSVAYTSASGDLRDVNHAWKAVSGTHRVQVKVSAGLPEGGSLISYESDLVSISVKITVDAETIKVAQEGIVVAASSVAAKADTFLQGVADSIDGYRKEKVAEGAARQAVSGKGQVLGASTSRVAASAESAVTNGGLSALSFLIHHWIWTLSAGLIIWLFFKFRSKGITP